MHRWAELRLHVKCIVSAVQKYKSIQHAHFLTSKVDSQMDKHGIGLQRCMTVNVSDSHQVLPKGSLTIRQLTASVC